MIAPAGHSRRAAHRRQRSLPTSSIRRRVPAGLFDSGCASLATFFVGLAAVHALPAASLGAYSLAFTAFLFISSVPASLIFMPEEVAAVAAYEGLDRFGIFRSSIPRGSRVAAVASFLGTAVMLSVPSTAPFSTRLGLGLGLFVLGLFSATQDHVRRVCHASGMSWIAASISAVQLGFVCAGLVVLFATGQQSSAWAPFVLLAAANVTSLTVGLIRVRALRIPPRPLNPEPILRVLRTGGWLLSYQLTGASLGFVLVALVTAFSGADAVGFAEAARTLVQPPTVLIVGMSGIILPEIQSAAARYNTRRVWQLQAKFAAPILLITVVWGLIVIPHWPHSPLSEYFPRAYAVPGLLLIVLIGQILSYSNGMFGASFLARGKARRLATSGYSAMAVALIITIVFRDHGALTLAWATAAGEGLQTVVLLVRQRRLLRTVEPEPIRRPQMVASGVG